MKRASKRRKISLATIAVDPIEKAAMRCCICSKNHAIHALLELSAVIDMVDGHSSSTIASVIEEVARIKVMKVPQNICKVCWDEVHAAYFIVNKIRQSKHLLFSPKNEHGNEEHEGTSIIDSTSGTPSAMATTTAAADIGSNFLLDENPKDPPDTLSYAEYECEYLDEYLEPSRSDDHTYDSRREEDGEGEIEEGDGGSLSLDGAVMKDEKPPYEQSPCDHNVTRQFEMPRAMFVQRNELHDQYRELEVTGERCCGCSFVAQNRKELLQHSETVHAIEMTDSGDYCPICFFKFDSDRQLERHIQEFKSTTILVCLQCNRFYNIRQKLYNHLLKCGDGNGEAETDDDEEENEDYAEGAEDAFNCAEPDTKLLPVNDSLAETYQRKMLRYRALFDEIISNEVFACELGETELNVQEFQIVVQHSFDTFKYVRLRGERCCGCSFTCSTREQLMQHGALHNAAGENTAHDHACSLCATQFHDEREIVKHLSFFTSKELFFCTICNESFLNRECLRKHQGESERHREHQLDKFQQAGIEMIGPVWFVELELPEVIEQLDNLRAEKSSHRTKVNRYIPMPEDRFIKSKVEHKNYCVLTVFGQRCCGCGKFFDTQADLKQHSRQEHTLPLGSSWVSDHLQCEICFGVFDFERGLALHRTTRRCNKTNLYLCKLCGLLFTKKFCLARHMQSAPNHLSQLIVDASSSRKIKTDGEQADDVATGDTNDAAESDPRVTEALQLHKSVQEAGLEKAGHFVGYHCCFSKCTHTFITEEELLEHSREEHSGKRRENEGERKSEKNVCPSCCKPFQDLAKLAWHRFQRFVPRQYNCKHCDKSFDKWPKLKLHVETEHRTTPSFVCTYCDKPFILNSRLKAHMKIHTSKKEFACDVCGDKFGSNGLMKRHRRSVHSKEMLFECKLCPKRFPVIEKLQIHQRVHTGEKPFGCSYCPRAFSHYTDRRRHEMAAHTGERPYKCQYCSAAYVRNRELSLHMQKHTDCVYILNATPEDG